MHVHECVSAMAAAVLHMLGPHEPLPIHARLVPDQLSAALCSLELTLTPSFLRVPMTRAAR